MPAPISIIIPTLNAEAELSRSLPVLMEGLHAGLIRELIVTDGGSTDHTLEIAEEAGAEIVSGPHRAAGNCGGDAPWPRGNGCWFCMRIPRCRTVGPNRLPSI